MLVFEIREKYHFTPAYWTVIAWPVFEPVTLWIVGAGTDLNRIWDESSEHVHPTVHGVKQLIDMLSKLVSKFIFLVSFFHLYTEIFYIITQWSCSASGSLWEIYRIRTRGPRPQKVWCATNETPRI